MLKHTSLLATQNGQITNSYSVKLFPAMFGELCRGITFGPMTASLVSSSGSVATSLAAHYHFRTSSRVCPLQSKPRSCPLLIYWNFSYPYNLRATTTTATTTTATSTTTATTTTMATTTSTSSYFFVQDGFRVKEICREQIQSRPPLSFGQFSGGIFFR